LSFDLFSFLAVFIRLTTSASSSFALSTPATSSKVVVMDSGFAVRFFLHMVHVQTKTQRFKACIDSFNSTSVRF
jgi:hypothetical protein